MTGLVMQFIICVYNATWYESCVDILDQMVAEETVPQYTIWVVWFPEDSIANDIVNYWYDQSSGNLDMIATFMAENWGFDVNKVSRTNDYGLCQLHYNRTNAVWIDDPRWSDPMYQAEVCLDKRKAVPNPSKVWYGWKNREKIKERIYYY